ncbi:antitoxin of toxin-antitoxin stability system [Leucobacter insecticola]|uniref:Antitoxin of toxin-antitoxin stability system n=1 Tax=Leucobacter insecticola TaxID=2714934 RepID=A0A6G8FK70_9MICO|nr:antitoxin of toxin-antitoxin stability system [Leucobacter insecticola]QIM16765.1 antitoxin of toxin-antitoxin stability system [Leucobacter insecticola]
MSKSAVFTMKLEQELRDSFVEEARAVHRPASQIARELMRDYVERQRSEREYQSFLTKKVELARASLVAGGGIDSPSIEAEFADRRNAAV